MLAAACTLGQVTIETELSLSPLAAQLGFWKAEGLGVCLP